MRRADTELRLHAGSGKAIHIGDSFIVEWFDITYIAQCWWQSAQILSPGWRGVRRHIAGDPALSEIHIPAQAVRSSVPDRSIVVAGTWGLAVVQHRADRYLEGDINVFSVSCQRTDCSCKIAACAGSCNNQLVRARTQLLGMVFEPQQRPIAILKSCWIRCFGGLR